MYCQIANDSLGGNYIYPIFYESFSAEESWEIHKEAYIKQLKAKGLTVDEIEKKIIAYEKQKEEFIAQIYEQRRLAAIQRKEADKQRMQAEIQRAKANEQRKQAVIQRAKADKQRKQAIVQSKIADEQRKQADIQRAKADEQRQRADIQRAKANEQRKLADIQRAKADKQRKKAEEWRNSFENILTENIKLSSQSVNIKPILFKVNKKTSLLFGIKGKISSGSTLIEIFNPSGKKKGELSLEHKTTSGSTGENEFFKSTSGYLNKTISDSEVGDWQIKISSQKSEGIVNITVAQYVKPTVDE
jgi:cell wall-associated NlpC family hydrolase